MEFDQQPDGPRVPLPFKSVDTGMGLERIASVVQGVLTNYDTDLFTPIHGWMRELLGHDPDTFEAERFSYQVIADHARAVTFLAGDGVRPSNDGRGYVMRKILRRAVRHGRLLGRHEPFLADLGEVVVDIMAGAYPHLADKRAEIHAVLGAEERQFARTLDAGTIHFEDALVALTSADRVVGRRVDDLPADAPVLPGEVAFRLHDTYGFPIDLTIELAAEYGVRVDQNGFETALAEQRERSRGGRKTELAAHAQTTALYGELARRAGETQFLGYETTSADGQVLAILRDGVEYDELAAVPEIELREPAQAAAELILDKTPFYAEGGGQVGDHGVIRNAAGEIVFTVTDTQRPVPGLIVHRGELHGTHQARRSGPRCGRCRAACEDDAQPHRHAPASPCPAQHRRRAGPPGWLAGDARLPAFRLPGRPTPYGRRTSGDRSRGQARGARRPAGRTQVHVDGRSRGRRRRRVLR